MKNKNTAGILALLLGGLGIHKFYLGRGLQGLIYLLFFWTFIPALLGFIEGIIYLTMSEAAFNAKYNAGMAIAPVQQPQNIVVNVANTANSGPGNDVAVQIRALLALKSEGALTDEEFQAEKQKVLAAG